jgi:hypothetical protein
MPAIATDRLVDLHNDLTHYDMTIAEEMREYLRGHPVNPYKLQIDWEIEEALRTFKPEGPSEVECRRELLRASAREKQLGRTHQNLQCRMALRCQAAHHIPYPDKHCPPRREA